MIFTSLGILVASGAFLIAGIVRSSIPLLVISLIGTAVAAFVLLGTADLARRRAWEEAGVSGTTSNGDRDRTPFLGYDDMSASQVTKLVSSGALTGAQLVAVRQYEEANAARKSVLDRLDRAIRS